MQYSSVREKASLCLDSFVNVSIKNINFEPIKSQLLVALAEVIAKESGLVESTLIKISDLLNKMAE